jgi:hypothetical protein
MAGRIARSTQVMHLHILESKATCITIDFARTSFAGNFSQSMSEFVAQKIFCDHLNAARNTFFFTRCVCTQVMYLLSFKAYSRTEYYAQKKEKSRFYATCDHSYDVTNVLAVDEKCAA